MGVALGVETRPWGSCWLDKKIQKGLRIRKDHTHILVPTQGSGGCGPPVQTLACGQASVSAPAWSGWESQHVDREMLVHAGGVLPSPARPCGRTARVHSAPQLQLSPPAACCTMGLQWRFTPELMGPVLVLRSRPPQVACGQEVPSAA